MLDSQPITGATRDNDGFNSTLDYDAKDLLVHAARATGRSPIQILREFRQLAKGDGRLNMVEFVRYHLHDRDRFTEEQRREFISNDIHWPITHTCNNLRWERTTEDKMTAATLLAAGGVTVPETVAVIDRSPRLFAGARKISTPDDLRDLILSDPDQSYFGKIAGGMVSFGTFRTAGGDKTHIFCDGQDPATYEAFFSDFIGENSYLLQKVLTNHDDLSAYAVALATIRMVNLVTDTGVISPNAVISLPQGNNIADTLWRPGNIACDIDPATGRIRTVVRRGIEIEFLDDHPEVAGLMGLQLPLWDELRRVNETAALTFAPIRYQSTDIAITQKGPVVVEINYGGGFALPQNAKGRGLLTPEVRAFFEGCGYDFSQRPARRKLFGLI